MQKVIDEKITSPDTAIVTKSVTVYMVKTEDAWVLAEEGNETFLSALMGGLVSNVYSADHFADVGKIGSLRVTTDILLRPFCARPQFGHLCQAVDVEAPRPFFVRSRN